MESNDKKSTADSRGADGAGIGMEAISKANGISWVEPKNSGGEQGAGAKNHWDGTGAKENKVSDAASREPNNGGM